MFTIVDLGLHPAKAFWLYWCIVVRATSPSPIALWAWQLLIHELIVLIFSELVLASWAETSAGTTWLLMN
jgi:hypothetical protein